MKSVELVSSTKSAGLSEKSNDMTLSLAGYGGMYPRTTTGKLFVIVYTIPGMLLMMSYLNIFSTCILIVLRKVSFNMYMLSISDGWTIVRMYNREDSGAVKSFAFIER